eukprot:CAMPEP_0113483608 /NCGR_PEP_ID=MMETSP0014_2-20120614/23521_1 /TAXON_ID=2857 /ORGANISM="Nitzschia sp." /LENGTH=246 /DNA_ID=CAMNT_0000377159 /DNA_START=13 /DNA_END=753 /DNA_ORIENTATION=- /assembly_acc=CAM_ASM_000159
MAMATPSLHAVIIVAAVFIFVLLDDAVDRATGLQHPHPISQKRKHCLHQHHHQQSRRDWFINNGLIPLALMTTTVGVMTASPSKCHAAPPIAIIAEELGYFPVRSPKTGDIMYVPKRVTRQSSSQAIELAKYMKEKDIKFYGTYWCPHCARQKELFGSEAMSIVPYVECSPKGFGYGALGNGETKICTTKIDGYPTFRDPKGKLKDVSGEMPLEILAKQVGYNGSFDPSLETDIPPLVGASSCKIR